MQLHVWFDGFEILIFKLQSFYDFIHLELNDQKWRWIPIERGYPLQKNIFSYVLGNVVSWLEYVTHSFNRYSTFIAKIIDFTS